jgi:glycosyltransferase involved in cell wall biosynthesis
MPNILYLIDSLSGGGAERQFALLVKYLPKHWARRVWSMGRGPFEEVIRCTGIKMDIKERTWQYDISPILNLWQIIKEWSPDAVHSWGWMSTLAAAPMCKHLGVPLIDSTIRGGTLRRSRLTRKLAMHMADRVIANSNAGLKAWGINNDKGRIVYNGFDPERLKFCSNEKRRDGNPFTVIMTGRMILEFKDYLTFIKIARKVNIDYGLPIRFIALGNGPDRKRITEEASDLIQQGSFLFPDPELEIINIVRQADVGILLSPKGEGCSNSIMEYMICGLPVVCNDAGGNCELVGDGITGYLTPTIDVQSFVEKLTFLYTHPIERIVMGRAGKNKVMEEYSIERMTLKTIEVYSELFH